MDFRPSFSVRAAGMNRRQRVDTDFVSDTDESG